MCKSQLLCISGSCQKFLRINNSQLWRNKWPQTHQLSLKVVCGPLKSPPQSVLRIASEWVMICRHVLFIMNGENTNTKDGAFYINVPSTLNFYVFGCWGCCDPPPRDEGLQYCEQSVVLYDAVESGVSFQRSLDLICLPFWPYLPSTTWKWCHPVLSPTGISPLIRSEFWGLSLPRSLSAASHFLTEEPSEKEISRPDHGSYSRSAHCCPCRGGIKVPLQMWRKWVLSWEHCLQSILASCETITTLSWLVDFSIPRTLSFQF